MMTSILRKILLIYLSTTALLMGFGSSDGMAALVTSAVHQELRSPGAGQEGDLRKIQAFLESKIVSQRVKDLGFTVEEIQSKLSGLSEDQVHEIAQRLDGLQMGGNAGLGIVIGLLVLIILAFILLHITGHKIIITK